jgi:hypothetical protein
MKIWGIILVSIVTLAFVCSPVLAVSKSELMASYRTTDHFPTFRDSTTDIPPIEVLSPENPFHSGESVYCDLKGNILVDGAYSLWGFSDLPGIKPKWTGTLPLKEKVLDSHVPRSYNNVGG